MANLFNTLSFKHERLLAAGSVLILKFALIVRLPSRCDARLDGQSRTCAGVCATKPVKSRSMAESYRRSYRRFIFARHPEAAGVTSWWWLALWIIGFTGSFFTGWFLVEYLAWWCRWWRSFSDSRKSN